VTAEVQMRGEVMEMLGLVGFMGLGSAQLRATDPTQ
jgi:hypothetical protein